MKFAVGVPGLILYPAVLGKWEATARPEDILRIAQKADELGYDYLSVTDHIIMPQEMVQVMGPRYPEAFAFMAFLAGATKRIRVLTNIMVLPYRNPLILAKAVATLDFLCGGRVTLGVAAGHLQREFEILKVPFQERGALTDEYLLAMKELWTSDQPRFQGKHVQFDGIVFEPKPLQKPHPPLWIGGNSRAAMRRAANLGDGWTPWLITRQQLPQCLAYIREQPSFQQRTGPFDVYMNLTTFSIEDYSHRETGQHRYLADRDETIEEIGRLQEAGATVTTPSIPPTSSVDEFLDRMEWFAQEIMPLFQG